MFMRMSQETWRSMDGQILPDLWHAELIICAPFTTWMILLWRSETSPVEVEMQYNSGDEVFSEDGE